ncbi:MAG: hypothetical protein Q9172_004288 [Xanthocarpia lactea]
MLNWASFSHIFGRRPVLLLALVVFASGAIICGVSHSFTVMLVGRSVQGAGAGGLLALTQILLTDMVPLRDRGKYLALLSIVWAIGSVMGPIIGGALSQHGQWRWVFWINLPIVGVGFIGIVFFLKLHYRNRAIDVKLAEIDYVGSFLFTASATSFLIPITWGSVMYPWSSWHTLVPLTLGVAGLLAFCLYEAKFASATLLPLRLFKNRTTTISYFGTFIHGMILWSMLFYLPLYFQGVHSYTPITAGVASLPQSCTVVPCAMVAGIVAGKTGRYRWALWLGWSLTTLGCGVLCVLDSTTGTAQWILLLLVSGVGLGLLFPSMSLAIQASVPQEDVAVAATLLAFFRAFGQTTGIAVGGVIFQNRMLVELAAIEGLAGSEDLYSLDAVALVTTIKQLPTEAMQTFQLKTALAHSLRILWAVMCGLAALATVASFFVEGYDLDQVHVTEQGFVGGKTDETLAQVADQQEKPGSVENPI